MSNGPRDPAPEVREEEEENGYDYPKPRLPLPPARRTLSELGGSSSSLSNSSSLIAFSRLSLDSDAGAAACKYRLSPVFPELDFIEQMPIVKVVALYSFCMCECHPFAAASLAAVLNE